LPKPNHPLNFDKPIDKLPPIGHHYFDSAGTPVFDLSTSKTRRILFAAKTFSIKAPWNADAGPAKTGAVDWLLLDAKSLYTSIGLKQAYRVVTAGGIGSTCTEFGIYSVDSATEYWLYN
jgi:uncharacterized protein DUF3455